MWQFFIVYDLFFLFVFGLPLMSLCLVCLYLCLCVCCLFLYLCLSCLCVLSIFWFWPTNPNTQWIPLRTLLTKNFLNFTLFFFFFCHLSVAQLHLSLLCPTTNQQRKNYIYKLYSLIYIMQERESQTQSDNHKAKKPKKKTQILRS